MWLTGVLQVDFCIPEIYNYIFVFNIGYDISVLVHIEQ